jgi:hypothetical protein
MPGRNRGTRIGLATLTCLIFQTVFSSAAESPVSHFSTGGRNIYRLASAELDGTSDAREILGSTYDDKVCAFGARGEHFWDVVVGGFVFDLVAGDLDGDGIDETLAACADSHVYAIGSDGTLLWKQDLDAPVWQVATARIEGNQRVALAGGINRKVVVFSADGRRLGESRGLAINGIVRMMRAGDFDGDGSDEVAVLPVRGQAKDLVFLRVPDLTPRKERIPFQLKPWDGSSPEAREAGQRFRSGKRSWNAQALRSANGTTADLDGDGIAELIFNPGAYSLKGGLRQTAEFPDAFKVPSYDRHYNMRMVAAGELTDAPGAEIVLLEGCEIRVLDSHGRTLGAATAPFGFTDMVYVPGSPRGHVLLGSSPNGDDNVYRLRFDDGWEEALAALERRGVMADVENDLRSLADAIGHWDAQPLNGASGPCDIVVDHHMWSGPNMAKLDSWMAGVRAYEEEFPYANLRFSTCFWPGEDAPLMRPDGKPWPRDQRLAHDLKRDVIVAGAKRFEAAGCHFWVQVGHGCDPHCEVATCAAILEAAPHTCLGFVSAEDEQLGDVLYYFEHHIRPILELCLEHGKRFIPRNKDVWWLHWPADPRMRQLIFNGRYRSVILPGVEDSNSRTTGAQLAARVGLWLDGQVDDWCCRVSADWFCASRSWEWEYVMTGHPHLRYLTSQAALGARVFMFLSGERARRGGGWTRVGQEGAANFLHLLGNGILAPPRREQLRAVSPVTLVMQNPTKRFEEHGANGHHPEWWNEDGTDARPWPFDRLDCYWAMAPLPETDVATLLWGRTRRSSENIVTTSPHGFVCVVPGGVPQTDERWTSLWVTDGDRLLKAGKPLPFADARALMKSELIAGTKAFPLRVEGRVFHQIIEHAPDHLVVVLVDPGWLDPADREVKIGATEGNWAISDRLTGEVLGGLQQPITLRVPAGVFRLLDARRE